VVPARALLCCAAGGRRGGNVAVGERRGGGPDVDAWSRFRFRLRMRGTYGVVAGENGRMSGADGGCGKCQRQGPGECEAGERAQI